MSGFHDPLGMLSGLIDDLLREGNRAADKIKDQYDRYIRKDARELMVDQLWSGIDGTRYPLHVEPTYNTFILLLELLRVTNQVGFVNNPPPVTTALAVANVAAFFKPGGWVLSSVALNPHMVWRHKQWPRLITSAFVHRDVDHLLSNMQGLLLFGTCLERRVGSANYAAGVALLTLLSSSLFVLTGWAEATWARNSSSYYLHGLVGFSGVGFGLMVLDGYKQPSQVYVYGCQIPSKYSCWVSLMVSTLLMPSASFRGHVCGIAAGLLLVFGPHGVRQLQARIAGRNGSQGPRVRTWGSGTPSGAPVRGPSRYWLPPLNSRAVSWRDLLLHTAFAAATVGVAVLGRATANSVRQYR